MANEILNNKENRNSVIDMIKKLSAYFNEVRDTLSMPYGLSSIQAVIILDIFHNPNETKVTDICKRLNKSTNTISPLINRLVDKGFLSKEKSKQDARVTYVSLTPKTQKIVDSFNVDVTDYVWPMFDLLSDEDFSNIFKSLEKLVEVSSK